MKIKDCYSFECQRIHDDRGFFQNLFINNKYPLECKQINWSFSKKNVLRGIHVSTYSKLVSCISGKIFDVIVDLRIDSPTFMQWESIVLDANLPKQVYIPENCGHGFLALEESMVVYSQSEVWQNKDFDVRYDTVGIVWPVEDVILSIKDQNALTVQEYLVGKL